MKLKHLNLFFSLFFLLAVSGNLLQSNELKDILKESIGQSADLSPTQTENKKKLSETVLSSIPKRSSLFSQPVTFVTNVFATQISNSNLSSTPTGSVRFQIDGSLVATQPLINGTAKFITSSLTTDSSRPHYIEAIYLGDETYDSSRSDMNFLVLPANTATAIRASPNPSSFGKSANFIVNVRSEAPATATPTGSIKFYIDAVNREVINLDADGKANFFSSDMNVGNHTITAIYQNNENFIGSKADIIQQVEKANSTTQLITLENPSLYGQSVSFQTKVSSDVGTPSGVIQFLVDGTNYGAPVSLDGNGKASINIRNWISGNHTVQAYYAGDERFNPSQAFLTQQVNQAPTKLALISSDNPSTYGQSLGVTAKIESPNTQPIGYIQFRVDGKVYGTPQPLPRNGQVTINVSQLKAGDHEIVADYLGDENFIPSSTTLTQQVKRAKTTGLTSSENPSTYGDTIKITATVKAEDLVPTGFVQFKINEKEFGKPHILSISGQAAINISELDAGSYKIEVDYLGSENFSPSNAALIQQINKAKTETEIYSVSPSIYGQAIKVLVAVLSARDLIPVGTVQFKLNGENYGEPQTLSKRGQASIIFEKLKAGHYNIEADYLGNQNFISSDADLTQQVNKAETSTSVASSVNPVVLGESVTFTASINASELVKGTVQFKINGKNVDDPQPVNENNQASLTIAKELKEGTQEVIATYSGDENFNSSISPPLLQVAKLAIFPPSEAQGFQVETPLNSESEMVNVIKWAAPKKGAPPAAYRIYADQTKKNLIATIMADRPLEFIDPVRAQEPYYQYFIVSVDTLGNESEPITVKIMPVPNEKKANPNEKATN